MHRKFKVSDLIEIRFTPLVVGADHTNKYILGEIYKNTSHNSMLLHIKLG